MTTTAISNVHVFDGTSRRDQPSTVLIGDGVILAVTDDDAVTPSPEVETVDGGGGTLLPGLIDAHIHLSGKDDLRRLTEFGVTTALDMSTWPPELVASLRAAEGLTDIRSAEIAAIGPGGAHARMPGLPTERIITTADEGRRFVEARIAEGADYIKIVVEAPGAGGPDQETIDALVEAAHDAGLLVVAHAVTVGAFGMALNGGVDIVTHSPLDGRLDDSAIARMLDAGTVSVPTLTMMAGVARSRGIDAAYGNARANVSRLHAAGVPILAGTDANNAPGVPSPVAHGESLHEELGRLVEAGLTPTEALVAATRLPAGVFGLDDRGAIEAGLRADLVLVQGDPTSDISSTRDIQGIWIAGLRVSYPG